MPVDPVRYAEASAALLNTEISDVDDLRTLLSNRSDLAARSTDRDCMMLRSFQRQLRPVFEAAGSGDEKAVVITLNRLLAQHPITTQLAEHDKSGLHLHVGTESAAVADQLVGEALLGLATLVSQQGGSRLGLCSASPCQRVFVDISPNQSRRYCSDRCCSRANVAAYRARRKQVAAGQGSVPPAVSA